MLQGAAQPCIKLHLRGLTGIHLRIEETEGATTGGLSLVHGHIGMLTETGKAVTVARIKRNANRTAAIERHLAQLKRRAQICLDFACHLHCPFAVLQLGQHQKELITTQTADRIGFTYASA